MENQLMEARTRFVGKNSTDKIKVENFNKNAVFGRGEGGKHISKPTQTDNPPWRTTWKSPKRLKKR
jgi:hypothetical protein